MRTNGLLACLNEGILNTLCLSNLVLNAPDGAVIVNHVVHSEYTYLGYSTRDV